ncbi:MAG TPA: type II secretion system F family protein [Azospirillum sp.]|nr:type II secretion system F family protein [Azospirillum sp.]
MSALNTLGPQAALLVLAGAALVFALSLAGFVRAGDRRRLGARIDRARGRLDAAPAVRGGSLSGGLARLGEAVAASVLVGRDEAARMALMLAAAGISHPRALAGFVGVKSLLAVLGLGLAHLWLHSRAVPPGLVAALGVYTAAALAGWRGPDLLVARRRKHRLEAIDRGMPDALDLLVICGEAGLGFDVAVARVAREIGHAHPELGQEFAKLAAEMRVLPDRAQALSNMAERLPLEGVRSFTGMLAQAIRYGTPLSQALRVISAELRAERMVRFEARAARLPVFITLPMILFILPCVFIVVGGPALLDALHMLPGVQGGALP